MKKIIIFIAILLVVVGIPLAKKYSSDNSAKAVMVETVSTQTIKASILASGQLKHEEEVKLTSEVIGKVSRLYVKEGDLVRKNQLVLEIDAQTYHAAVAQQQAVVNQQLVVIQKQKLMVDNLTKQWERKKRLFQKKLLDSDAYEAATHQRKVAEVELKASQEVLKQVEAQLEQAEDRLSKTKIVSPLDGKITSLDIKEGETAISSTTNIAGSSLMTIANPESMLAEINVDEADIANVQLGQQAEIIAVAFSETPLTGTVNAISSSAKQALGRQSLSFAVKLKLSQHNDIQLRPGMTCRAEVFTQNAQDTLAIPIKSIQTQEDIETKQINNFVFVAVNNQAIKKQIKTGISNDEFQEVTQGLKVGDKVIVGPDTILRHLKNEDSISLKNLNDNS